LGGVVETQAKRVGNLELELIRLKEELQGNNKAMPHTPQSRVSKIQKMVETQDFLVSR
jgi:hypothetical protein